MPPPSTTTLSPAELAKLEQAFATAPSSDAYKALAEAYLGLGRFMEAMVICKKGVKAHLTSPEPRLLLARVYAEQGKDRKALEEAQGALQVAPTDKAALRMVGGLQLKLGEMDAGRENLLKAHAADPADPDTLAALQQHGVTPAAAPAPVPAAAEAPLLLTPAPAGTVRPGGARSGGPPVLFEVGSAPAEKAPSPQAPSAPTTPVAAHAPAPAAPAPGASPTRGAPAASAQRTAQPRRPAPVVEEEDEDELPARAQRRKASGLQRAIFLVLLVAAPAGIGGYNYLQKQERQRVLAVGRALNGAEEELKHDSFDSYQKATREAEEALAADPESVRAHGFLAYAWTLRWAEHGGGDEARARAERHLAAGKAVQGELSSHLLAADALFKMRSGKTAEAEQALSGRIAQLKAEKKQSSLLYLTLGIIQLNAGDLDASRESLELAQALAPADPRVYSALGTLFRRRGQDALSEQSFDSALRYERNHPESLLGKALLQLQQEQPNYAAASELLKKLIDGAPPPSPRQVATAQLARALLIGRLLQDLPSMEGAEQRRVLAATGVPADRARAEAELEKAEQQGFSTDRQNPELYLLKGQRLLRAGQVDAAADALRRAIQLEGTRAQFHLELARALMRKPGGEAEAAEALRTALRTMGESPKLVMMLGDAYRRQGKLEEAAAQFTRAIGNPADPKTRNSEARVWLGATLRERKELVRAQEELEKATQELVSQPSKLAAAYTELARVLAERGQEEKADDAFQRALNSDAAYAPGYLHYARFLAESRRQAARARLLAREYLKRAPRGELAAEAQRLAQ